MRVEGLIQDDIYVELLELLEVSGEPDSTLQRVMLQRVMRLTSVVVVYREATSSFRIARSLDVSLCSALSEGGDCIDMVGPSPRRVSKMPFAQSFTLRPGQSSRNSKFCVRY